uniref:D-alanyl-D-alanine carboxypeptidase family protein n=1 Tax=Bacillus altitudinis TaxID=293387 RepID=UPI001643D866
ANSKHSAEHSFPNTKQPKSLAKHPHQFRFIIPYPKPKQKLTPYQYQPSHLTYLPSKNPKKVKNTPKTLQQYLN